jgi:hypothetical protein
MRRFSPRTWVATATAALAAMLLIAGGLLLWGSAYVHNTVQSQLAEQQITFPPAAAFAHPKAGSEITPNMIPSVSQYAGQQLLTGQQAEAYADHFIAQHVTDMAGGKTYSQLSAESLAQPNNTQLAGLVNTVFKGETLRSMLLNAYGWWKVSQITYIIALVSFGLGALAAVLLIAGGLLLWGSAYVHNTVQGQLAAQQITFPPAAAFAHPKAGSEITPNMIPSVSQYAGQQLLTGQQAEAYADHFIAQHVTDMSGGKTYSQLSAASIAQPNNTQLAGLVATVFKGETLRSMLLNAYGWWKVSQITYIAALIAFGLGGLTAIGTTAAAAFGRKPDTTAQILAHTSQAPAKAA